MVSEPVHPWELESFGGEKEEQPIEEELESLPTAEEIEAIRQSAYTEGKEQGYAEGYQEGMQQAEQERNQLKQEMEAVIHSMTQPLDDLDSHVSAELAELAIMVTKQIIRREIHQNPDQIIAVVRDSIKLLPSTRRKVMVQLHPEDANLIRKIFSLEDDQSSSWMIADDPSISRGGCMISTDSSNIDASIETRIATIFSHVLGDLRATSDDETSE